MTGGSLAGIAAVPLGAVLGPAALLTRTDRKYVVTPEVLASVTGRLGDGVAALEIGGGRAFRYESVYFDTPALDSYLGAAYGRRRRFKVRTRSYLDSGTCVLEVKTRSGRDETVKHRMPYDASDRHRLTAEGLAFVAEHVKLPPDLPLSPVLTTSYRRSTLVDLVAAARITCDEGLVCSRAGDSVGLAGHVLVETKSAGPPTAADRVLWRYGHRPVTVSKFGVGMAALDPSLPANRWNRILRRYFAWAPAR